MDTDISKFINMRIITNIKKIFQTQSWKLWIRIYLVWDFRWDIIEAYSQNFMSIHSFENCLGTEILHNRWHIHTLAHTHTHATHTRTHAHARTNTRENARTGAHTRTHADTRTRARTRARTHARTGTGTETDTDTHKKNHFASLIFQWRSTNKTNNTEWFGAVVTHWIGIREVPDSNPGAYQCLSFSWFSSVINANPWLDFCYFIPFDQHSS